MYPYYRHFHHGNFPSPPQYYTYSWPYLYRQQFPGVNPALFMSSAKHMQTIMKDASILLGRMSSSREFSYSLMEAAQQSNQQKVASLLKDTGIQTTPEVSYTPDGLKLDFDAYIENLNCCHLTLSLRWLG